MTRKLRWYQLITLNLFWFGTNLATGTLTPLLLPYLVALFVPVEQKNTYFSYIRVSSLAVAMLVQPAAGMLSDRSTSPMGRRRPYMLGGMAATVLCLGAIGASPLFMGSPLAGPFPGVLVAYLVLWAGVMLFQFSNNVASGSALGLIPDLAPEDQRGVASGVKALMEFLPALVIAMGILASDWLVEQEWATLFARLWGELPTQVMLIAAVLAIGYVIATLLTALTVREDPITEKPDGSVREPLLRLLALTAIFVATSQVAVRLVGFLSDLLERLGATDAARVTVVGLAALAAMAGAVFVGVYLGAWVGIGREARHRRSFIWWVVNRLLFLAGVGSIQSFALYFLADVTGIANPAGATAQLLVVSATFLVIAVLAGGYVADRIGRKPVVALSSLVATAGTLVMLFSQSVLPVLAGAAVLGMGAGAFMASNWALGTDLAPPDEAGRYLGIANLAGAGAGIVGAGIGGPLADTFNALQPGLGYKVIFALYGALFLISALVLLKVKTAPNENALH
ncbi:MAG: MFS transporter [Anaerolineae bacterium]|jgi:MFS family permease